MSQIRKSHDNPQLPNRGLCAHRGAMATHPENTLPAFREAIRCGAHMIEFDVQFSKDNVLVVMHDPTVDRTTDGHGPVAELTYQEIRKLDAGGWKSPAFQGVKVPALDEVLSMMPVNIWLNIHLKGGRALGPQTALVIERHLRLPQAFLACDLESAQGAKAAVPGIMICNMEQQNNTRIYVEDTCRMGSQFIQIAGAISLEYRAFTTALKAHGIRVNYFGTDDPGELRML
ncbi:MAG: glycerophosphodiester phosphodiesterase family protein, partial [Anaerolineae bacterium]|nr:glycerophosphodiester phosphodiesterase family protein [Anaerolineae bacterium]